MIAKSCQAVCYHRDGMTPAERERYSRQVLFPGLGEPGQRRLLAAHAAIVGCGALGTVEAILLARAGVGRLTIIDRDFVEPANLPRQLLFDEADAAAALPKAAVAEQKLAQMNSSLRVAGVVADLAPDNIAELLAEAELILDGTDNYETRYLINDYALSRGVPWIYGAALGSYGITMPVIPARSACLRCLYPEPPAGAQPTCETAGVLAPVTSIIASLQAAEALKILSGQPDLVKLQITTVDIWEGRLRQAEQPPPAPDCPACALGQFVYLNGSRRSPVSLCGRNAVQIHERARPLDLAELGGRLAAAGEVRANDFALRFFPVPFEMTIFPDGRAIIKGTSDPGVARSLYARYIGA